MNQQRNVGLDLFKLYLSVCVLLFHGYIYIEDLFDNWIIGRNGTLAVEGFLIISGVFMAASLERNRTICLTEYMSRKIQRILPFFFTAYSIGLLENIVETLKEGDLDRFLLLPMDILLLQCTGIPTYYNMVPIWYISGMLLGMIAIFPFLKKFRRAIAWYALPIALIIYGVNYQLYGRILPKSSIGIDGLFRAGAGLLLGVSCYYISQVLKEICLSKKGKVFTFAFMNIMVIISSILICKRNVSFKYDIFIVFAWFIIILILYSDLIQLKSKNLNPPMIEDFTLALYLNQYPCKYLSSFLEGIWKLKSFEVYILYILMSILCSLFWMKFARSIYNYILQKLKALLLERKSGVK